jgi:Holliday junction resolvase RusA-like endonuclease
VAGKLVPFLKSSEAYEAYRDFAVGQILRQYRGEVLGGHLALEVIVRVKGRMRIDYSNALDSVCDILEDASVIKDDGMVEWICGGKILGANDWSVHVKVYKAEEAIGVYGPGASLNGRALRPDVVKSLEHVRGLDGLDFEKSIARHALGPGETLQRYRRRKTQCEKKA